MKRQSHWTPESNLQVEGVTTAESLEKSGWIEIQNQRLEASTPVTKEFQRFGSPLRCVPRSDYGAIAYYVPRWSFDLLLFLREVNGVGRAILLQDHPTLSFVMTDLIRDVYAYVAETNDERVAQAVQTIWMIDSRNFVTVTQEWLRKSRIQFALSKR